MTVERSPAPFSQKVALLAAAPALVASIFSFPGIATAVGGVALLGWGVYSGSRKFVSGGAFVLFLGVLLGSLGGTPLALLPLLGAAGSVVAWDVGENAISVGRQLGSESDTRRAELFHAGASAAVGLTGALVGFVVYRIAWGGQPLLALVALLVAGLFLLLALRE